MELRRLRYFLAVAEEGGFTRAAARLRVSQPTLSQQIQALERTVGGALFDRQPGGSRLTPAGEALLGPARRALDAVADGLRAARDIAGSTTGPLRVGMVYGAAGAVTQPILSAFTRAFPDVQLHFRGELPVGQAYTALLDDEVDVAFTRLPLDPLRHTWITLYEERRVLVVHERHPLANAETVTLKQALPLPILAPNPARNAPEVNDYWLLNDYRNGEPPPLHLSEAWTVVEIAQTLVQIPTVVAMCSEIARQMSPIPEAPLRFLDFPEVGISQAVIARRKNDQRPIVEAFCHLAATVSHRHATAIPQRRPEPARQSLETRA